MKWHRKLTLSQGTVGFCSFLYFFFVLQNFCRGHVLQASGRTMFVENKLQFLLCQRERCIDCEGEQGSPQAERVACGGGARLGWPRAECTCGILDSHPDFQPVSGRAGGPWSAARPLLAEAVRTGWGLRAVLDPGGSWVGLIPPPPPPHLLSLE